MRVLVIALLMIICTISVSFAKEVPFTLEDRDRLIRVEEGLKSVNQRIDSLEKRVDGIQNLLYVLIGAILTQTLGIVGFVLWDRRTTLAPITRRHKEIDEELELVRKKTRELEERENAFERALREYAKDDSKLQEILRGVKLL